MVRNREIEPEIIGVQENTKKRRVIAEEEKLKKDEKDFESEYSEAEQAKDIEARSGDLSYLKKSKAFQQSHGSARILVVYKAISQQVTDLLEQYLQLADKDLRQARKNPRSSYQDAGNAKAASDEVVWET